MHVGEIGTAELATRERHSSVDSENLLPNLGLVTGRVAGQMHAKGGHWDRIWVLEIRSQVGGLPGRLQTRHQGCQHLDLGWIERSILRHVRAVPNNIYRSGIPPLVVDVQ